MMRDERSDVSREYDLDLRDVTDRGQLHDRLEERLALPAWYGRNLDALFDVLTGMRGLIRVTGFEAMKETLADEARGFRHVCEDAAQQTPGLRIVFVDEDDLDGEAPSGAEDLGYGWRQ